MPISMGLRIGPLAWSARVSARPSQNWARWNPALSTVGEFRPPRFPKAPGEVFSLSTPPRSWSTTWHELHDWLLFFESRLSKKRRFPSFTWAWVSFSDPGIRSGIVPRTSIAGFRTATASADEDAPRVPMASKPAIPIQQILVFIRLMLSMLSGKSCPEFRRDKPVPGVLGRRPR